MFKSGVYPRRPHTQTDKNIQELRFQWLWKGEQDHATVHHATHPTQSKSKSLKSCFPQIVCIFKRIAKLLSEGTARNFQTFPLGWLERVFNRGWWSGNFYIVTGRRYRVIGRLWEANQLTAGRNRGSKTSPRLIFGFARSYFSHPTFSWGRPIFLSKSCENCSWLCQNPTEKNRCK